MLYSYKIKHLPHNIIKKKICWYCWVGWFVSQFLDICFIGSNIFFIEVQKVFKPLFITTTRKNKLVNFPVYKHKQGVTLRVTKFDTASLVLTYKTNVYFSCRHGTTYATNSRENTGKYNFLFIGLLSKMIRMSYNWTQVPHFINVFVIMSQL